MVQLKEKAAEQSNKMEKKALKADVRHLQEQLDRMQLEKVSTDTKHETKLAILEQRARNAEERAAHAQAEASRSMGMMSKAVEKSKKSKKDKSQPIYIHNNVEGSTNTQSQSTRAGGYGGWGGYGWGGYGRWWY
jgi:hypothetical protein